MYLVANVTVAEQKTITAPRLVRLAMAVVSLPVLQHNPGADADTVYLSDLWR